MTNKPPDPDQILTADQYRAPTRTTAPYEVRIFRGRGQFKALNWAESLGLEVREIPGEVAVYVPTNP